ncbi:hypothetical protein N7447_008217 [Penicillium robsamsonii]|uniref:uncharacterized protein n=1 Tax=Penicillium robsamsonii TaxID=1792511 RepID=UPI002546C42D|nr:uncharacterized protein N7447_008217 [Penicillium robsamsonii]KAJ5815984.1 hypothetical protein N7447_008217 [Penicillium robsamsonii]
MTTAAVFGCTGAVGSQILATLLVTDTFSAVKTISRRLPNAQSAKLEALEESDTSKWGSMISSLSPNPSMVFNAVGTTTATAGSIKNQWKIDHDLCVENAQAAKEAGGEDMKVGVEDAIKDLGFDNAVILRPGMIIGREESKSFLLEKFVEGLQRLGQGVQDKVGQNQTTIGRAAVAAARMAEQGKAPSNYWVLEQADIVRLGRDGWKE